MDRYVGSNPVDDQRDRFSMDLLFHQANGGMVLSMFQEKYCGVF